MSNQTKEVNPAAEYISFGITYVFVDTFSDPETLNKSKKLIKDSGHSFQVKGMHLYQSQFKTRNY